MNQANKQLTNAANTMASIMRLNLLPQDDLFEKKYSVETKFPTVP